MNRNGPILAIAVDWATKPMPQMTPARSSSILACTRVIITSVRDMSLQKEKPDAFQPFPVVML